MQYYISLYYSVTRYIYIAIAIFTQLGLNFTGYLNIINFKAYNILLTET